MNSKDIWECLCKFLSTKEIGRFRVLSKMHNITGTRIIIDRSLVISPENLNDIINLIYEFVYVKAVIIDDTMYKTKKLRKKKLKKSEISQYIFDIYGSPDMDDLEDKVLKESEAHDIITGNKLLSLPYPMIIHNKAGINKDKRGTINKKLEFNNFHDEWSWDPGIYDINKFAQGLFHLKSHKFENWYEMMTGISPLKMCHHKFCGCKSGQLLQDGEIHAQLDCDHGS